MHTGINKIELQDFKSWFSTYVFSFKNGDADLLENINLKELHTHKVCDAIKDIGISLGLNEEALRFAEVIALFHDIGRFEQYRIYNTFMDSKSVNHASLGVEILLKNKVLENLSSDKAELILKAIRYHNSPYLPENETEECIFLSKLLRDADKFDIYRVVTEHYIEKRSGKSNKAIELNLPDSFDISEDVYRDILNRKSVNFKDVKNLNDFKLLQLAWVFDINFPRTYMHIKNMKYLNIIHDSMPDTTAIKEVFLLILDYLDNQIRLSVT